jgi:ATP-dependent DNA helicase RecQ
LSTIFIVEIDGALQHFGLTSFRPGQREVISQIVAGHDCLCVMPTGGGKSLCFQLPTIIRPGLTIVVSPLIALMKDQVDTLARRGISASLINSSLTNSEQNDRLAEMAAGKYAMVYVAPERLRNPRFLDAIKATPIQLLAVDEAHCISEWGHDFRPDYARIGQFREALGGVQTVALTATATPKVQDDICNILKLHNPQKFVTGFARTNLYLGSLYCNGDRDKDVALLDFLKEDRGSGIIYAATRKRCESLVETLTQKAKLSVGAYHAGLTLDQRKFIQEQFMSGKLKAIVATNAFGMGIDKGDLRYVIHYNIPGSIEAYYQEAGRAGRDGLPSQCVVLFSPQDRYIQEFFVENANPPREMVAKVYDFITRIKEDPIEMTSQEMKDQLDVPQTAEAVGNCLQILSRTGVIERLEVSGGLAMFRLSSSMPTMVDMLPKDAAVKRKVLRTVEKAVADRRDEAVYVHPRWLMQHSELDRDTLARHLSDLRKLPGFEYVPPFRGRAIHFRKRNIPFDQLAIDFKALEARKRADFEKLERVVQFAQGKICRQKSILQYFGDPDAKPCGLCDRCQGQAGWPKMPAVDIALTSDGKRNSRTAIALNDEESSSKVDELTQAQQSEILRRLLLITEAIGRHRGLFGKGIVTDFLCGGQTEKIQRLRLSRIQGYGILKGSRKKEVEGLLERMLSTELLESKMPTARRPTISVSELGWKAAKGEATIPEMVMASLRALTLDSRSLHMSGAANSVQAAAMANEKPKIDRTQTERPEEPRVEIDPIKSSPLPDAKVDESKFPVQPKPLPSKYPFEPIEHLETTESDRSEPELAQGFQDNDWQWTHRLAMDSRYSIIEMAAIRHISVDQVLEDLANAAKQGLAIPTQRLLDASTAEAFHLARIDPPAAKLHPVFTQRPALWRLAQAIRR